MNRHLEAVKKVNALPSAGRSANTYNGDAIDTLGFDEIDYTINAGAIAAGITSVNAKVQESADGSTGWADITDAAITALDGDDDNAIPSIGIRLGGRAVGNRKRYQRIVVVIAGTDEAEIGVVADLVKPHSAPVTNTPASVLV